MGIKISRSILVHDLSSIEVYIDSFRNRFLISIGSELWTKKDFLKGAHFRKSLTEIERSERF